MNWFKRKTESQSETNPSTPQISKTASPSPGLSSRGSSEMPMERTKPGVAEDAVPEHEVPHESAAVEGSSVGEQDEKHEHGGDIAQAVSSMSNDDNVVYPSGARLTIITMSLCFAVFLVALDQTIIATAM